MMCALTGCGPGAPGGSATVRVAPPHAAPAVTKLCAALRRKLPSVLRGHARREVRPSSPLTAAWADPAIVLRCGVPRPAALGPAAELTVVNGISWFAQPAGATVPSRFTEVGRQAYVELTVPARYSPAGLVLVTVSNAIAAAVPAKPGGRI